MSAADESIAGRVSSSAARWLWLASATAALGIFVLASVMESEFSFFLTYPGLLLTWPFWPEGIHTGRGGVVSAVGFYGVFVVGNLLLWTLLIRSALSLVLRLRRS